MPNTNPCPTCHAQLDPGTPHTFCARTKEPKARELAEQITKLADELEQTDGVVEAWMLAAQAHGKALAACNARLEELDSRTDQHHEAIFEGDRSVHARLEALERAKENTEHGGGGHGAVEDASASACEESTRPAASALPMPERPGLWDKWAGEWARQERAKQFHWGHEFAQLYEYALSLESRLAESNKHRNEYAESNLRTASKLADMSEAFARERADRDALKAKLAEAEAKVKFLVEREEHFASVLQVADGGQYRNDWDAAISRVIADRDALRAKLEASESELRRLQVVANEDRAVSDAIRGERDRLRAKLDAMSSGIADEQRSRHGLERRVTELEAKLDGVREALSDAISTVGGARVSCVGDHYIHSPQVRLDQVSRWRSALAAAENTNTGSSTVERHAIDESGKAQPVHGSSEGGEVGSIPAPCSPSPAPALEMTADMMSPVWDAIDEWHKHTSHPHVLRFSRAVERTIADLVRSELRKAREGYAQLCESQPGHSWCASAIRAASKEADSFRAGSSIND